MKGIDVRRWIDPSDAELERAVEVLIAAFEEDPFTAPLTGYDSALVIPETRSHLTLGLSDGEVYVAGPRDAPEDIAAVAIWYGPGQDFLHTEKQRSARGRDFSDQLSFEGQQWFDDVWGPAWEALHVGALGLQHSERALAAYHVVMLGVHPDKRRKGLGRALIETVVCKADLEAVEVILETSGAVNIAFYQSLGFMVIGEPVAVPYKGGEGLFVCFVRPAKATQ